MQVMYAFPSVVTNLQGWSCCLRVEVHGSQALLVLSFTQSLPAPRHTKSLFTAREERLATPVAGVCSSLGATSKV